MAIKKSNEGSVRLVTDPNNGEIIHTDTGEVVSQNDSSYQKEWRAFEFEDYRNRERTGSRTSLAFHDMGLSTVIGKETTDASGKRIDPSVQTKMGRLRRWNSRSNSRSPAARSLLEAFGILSRLKDKLGLPNHVVEKAAYLYRKAQHKGLIRGSTISSVLTASIYIAVRETGVPRKLDDIAKITNVSPKEAYRSYRRIVSELDIKVPALDPAKYIIKVANVLNFDERIKRKALDILEVAKRENVLAGKDPTGVAASIVYLVNLTEKLPLTQAMIAAKSGVTEVTIRNRSKEIRKKLGLDIRRSKISFKPIGQKTR